MKIFWISFASGVLRWWLENLLLPSIWVFAVTSIFFGNIVLSAGGQLQLGRFCKVSSTRLDWLRLYHEVFISIIVIYDFILLFFCSICSFLLMHQILYGWRLLYRREGTLASLGKSIFIEASSKSSQIDWDNIDHHNQGIYKVIQVRYTC